MVDIASVSLIRPLEEIAGALGASFEEHGFAIVRDHEIAPRLIADAQKQARAFFALPDAAKRAYHRPGTGGARGYTPFGTENAKGAAVHDLKEFWHIGRDLPSRHRYARYMGPNFWPDEVPQFRPAMQDLFLAFEWAGKRVLAAIALYLGEDEDFFEDSVRDGNSVLRLLHYPPVPPGEQKAVRAAPHEDINAITLLLGAEEAGLELLSRGGEWLPVSPGEGELAVNIGDMLQRLTAGRLRSTTHRVVNPAGAAAARSRYAMPFFLHFRPDFVIDTMGQDGEPPITAHAFLTERLREIGLG